jgi:L-threonylcarbamoyladenylate synthase
VTTQRLIIDPDYLETAAAQQALDEAARILREGGTVALPTETVYGLGANALDIGAVAKIFLAKERPGWDPMIVHVADEGMLCMVTDEVPEAARRLMAAFWPGPLTLLLPRSPLVPDSVTAGRPLVGVRMPAHRVMLEVIRRAGVPIAAPSANRFGHVSPTRAEHVLEDLDGRIDAVVDAGPTVFGVESTVLDPGLSPMIVYRPGAVTIEQIRSVAGAAELYTELQDQGEQDGARRGLPSPGVGLRHYAPRARLILVEDPNELTGHIEGVVAELHVGRVGVMWPAGLPGQVDPPGTGGGRVEIFHWGRWDRPEELAQGLFAGLRALDAAGCSTILCPLPSEEGIGRAIRDRLRKASKTESGG